MSIKKVYRSTKSYDHSVGLSCAFRQWRATSHCRFLHGYALKFKLTFEATQLDHRNWVMDFGGLKEVKGILEYLFDHKTAIAKDDPEIEWFREAANRGLIQPIYLDHVGCEKFAEYAFVYIKEWMNQRQTDARLVEVEVSEHNGNSAIYREIDVS